MSQQPSEGEQLEFLRQLIGKDHQGPVRAGVAGPSTDEERRQEHIDFMLMLHRGGSDPSGLEQIRRFFRRGS